MFVIFFIFSFQLIAVKTEVCANCPSSNGLRKKPSQKSQLLINTRAEAGWPITKGVKPRLCLKSNADRLKASRDIELIFDADQRCCRQLME